jgi:hypothetical protein
MEVPLRHIEALFKKTPIKSLTFDMSDSKASNAYTLVGGSIEIQTTIDQPYLEVLKSKKVEKVQVCVSRETLAELRRLFPSSYVPAQFEETLQDLKTRSDFIYKLNKCSERQRHVELMQEITHKDIAGRERVVFKLGTIVDDNFFKKATGRVDPYEKIQAGYNEEGILLYVPNPVENVKLRIDLLALLSKSNYPIYVADSTQQAIDIFFDKHPKLVIFTHLEKAWECKEIFLAAVKKDPFFHYFSYAESPSGNRDEEFARIEKLYHKDYQEKLDAFLLDKQTNKPTLDNEQKKPILDRIELLRRGFSKKGFVELQYYLHKVSAKFNVTTLENILNKVNP